MSKSETTASTHNSTPVLRLTTSILGEDSVSSGLMEDLLAGLQEAAQRDGKSLLVSERNFSTTPIPHYDGEWLQAVMTPEADRSDVQQGKARFSDELIAELQAAEIIVIGLPMYNFSLPSMLKAWNDHVARAGATFKYTESGPVGLLGKKKVYLVTAMGGQHEAGGSDFLRPYMQHFLGFLGLDDISFITADGLSMGDEARAAGLSRAETEINNAIEQYEQGAHNDSDSAQEEAA